MTATALAATVAIAAMLAVAGTSLTLLLVAARRRQAVFERRIRRIAAPLAGRAAPTEDQPEEVAVLRSPRNLGRLRAAIDGRYPLIVVASALPAAVGLGLLGGAAAVVALWFLRAPLGWWTPAVFAATAAAAAVLALSRVQKRSLRTFVAKFPDTVDQIVRLSATGVPVAEAVASVTEHEPHPVRPVLTMFSDYLIAGIDPEEAARAVSRYFRIPELTMFMAVVRLQRRSGGGVSTAFSNLSRTLRERRQAGLKAHASTAQTRFTLLILAVLPFILLLIQRYTSPDSIDTLFHTDVGALLLRWGFALIVTGLVVAHMIAARAAR